MFNLYVFDLKKILQKEVEISHFNFYLNNDKDTQKEFLEKSNIPKSSFLLAKKEKFINSNKLNNKIKLYYDIQKYDTTLVEMIISLINDTYTLLHYEPTINMKYNYDKFLELYEKTKNTQLEILCIIGMCLSLDSSNYKMDLPKWEMKIDVLIDIHKQFDVCNKYLILYCIINYYTIKRNTEMMIKYCKVMEDLNGLPEPLSVLANFVFLSISRIQKNHISALRYMNKAEDLCNIYYSEYLNQNLRGIKGTLYLLSGEYDLCIKYTLGEVVRLQSDDKNALVYITSLHNLSNCYLKIKKYNESLLYTNHIINYNIVDNENIPYSHHKVLEIKRQLGYIQKMYCYLKMNDLNKLNDLYSTLKVNNTVILLANVIMLLSKNDYKNYVKYLTLIKTKDNHYTTWLEIFEEEYKAYLIKSNKYISIYEM